MLASELGAYKHCEVREGGGEGGGLICPLLGRDGLLVLGRCFAPLILSLPFLPPFLPFSLNPVLSPDPRRAQASL